MDVSSIEYLSFEGGGLTGRRYMGAITALRFHLNDGWESWWNGIKGVSGTSIGGFAALIMVLNLNYEQMMKIFMETAERDNWIKHPDIGLAVKNFGIDAGHGIRATVKLILETGGLSQNASIEDLCRLTRKDVLFVSTDMRTGKQFYISQQNAANMLVTDALYASACLPGVYVPFQFQNKILIDGCMSENRPNVFPKDRTLFFLISHPNDMHMLLPRPTNAIDYVSQLIRCTVNSQNKQFLHDDPSYIYCAPCGKIDTSFSFETSSDKDLDVLLKESYAVSLNHLKNGVMYDVIASIVISMVKTE